MYSHEQEKYIMRIKDKKLWGEEPTANDGSLGVAMNWYNACIDSKELKKYLIYYGIYPKDLLIDPI